MNLSSLDERLWQGIQRCSELGCDMQSVKNLIGSNLHKDVGLVLQG